MYTNVEMEKFLEKSRLEIKLALDEFQREVLKTLRDLRAEIQATNALFTPKNLVNKLTRPPLVNGSATS